MERIKKWILLKKYDREKAILDDSTLDSWIDLNNTHKWIQRVKKTPKSVWKYLNHGYFRLSCMTFFGNLMVMAYMLGNNPGSTEKLMIPDCKGERKPDLLRLTKCMQKRKEHSHSSYSFCLLHHYLLFLYRHPPNVIQACRSVSLISQT